MRNFLFYALHLPGALRRIGSSDLPPGSKKKLRGTCLRTFLFRNYDPALRTAEVAGYKVRFCDYHALSYLFHELFLNQEYFFTADNDRPFILDCGSNIGMSVLYFKMIYPASEIVAFEPDADAFSCLGANVANNGLRSVKIYNKALSKKEGTVGFWRAEGHPGGLGNTLYPNPSKQAVSAESARLSGYIDRKVDFLKLDVEGAESEVLEELGCSGKLSLVKQMLIEYHLHMPGAGDALSGTLRLLENSGFGYQIGGTMERPFRKEQFQALHIYAYNKKRAPRYNGKI